MALGAKTRDIVGMVLRQGAWQLGLGVLAGVASALALSRVMSTLLYNVDAHDIEIFVLVPALLTAIALVSWVMPARRASSISPLEAMRED
jgi:ABC-type antimicrobial peptide transport system permease subunit